MSRGKPINHGNNDGKAALFYTPPLQERTSYPSSHNSSLVYFSVFYPYCFLKNVILYFFALRISLIAVEVTEKAVGFVRFFLFLCGGRSLT